jgi:hypothetical protein
MKQALHRFFFCLILLVSSGFLNAQSGIIGGDPIAYGENLPGFDLLNELADQHANPKSYRSQEDLDLNIITSATYIDISKGNEVEFSAKSQWAENYIWKFGDGTTTSGFQHVKHRYTTPGKYEISLLATSQQEVARQVITIHVIDGKAPLELEEMAHFYVFPADNKLEAVFDLKLPRKEKHLLLEMKDVAGTRIYQYEIGKVRRKQKVHVDLRNLEAGKYYAVIKGKRFNMVSRITVAR